MADDNIYVVNSPNLERAVARALTGDDLQVVSRQGRRPRGRSSFDEVEAPSFVYNGPFAMTYEEDKSGKKILKVAAGYLNRNGTFLEIPAAELTDVKDGFVCVTCVANIETGTWEEPKIEITTPSAESYPVGKITITKDGSVRVDHFYVAMAVVIITKQCPLAAANAGK